MKIIIVVTNYLDRTVISSKRWRCISKQLVKLGNEIDILAFDEGYIQEDDTQNNLGDIFYHSLSKKKEKPHNIVHTPRYNQKHVFNPILFLYYLLEEIYTKYRCKKIVKKILSDELLHYNQYDYVLCSVQNIDTFYIAKELLQYKKAKKLVCDIRDYLTGLIYGRPELDFLGKKQIIEISKFASFILTVNEGIADWIRKKTNNAVNVYVFPHGIDSIEDYVEIFNQKSDKKLVITWTGTSYPNLRIIEPIFSAIKGIGADNIKFIVAGKNTEEFEQCATKYHVENVLDNRKWLEREEAIRIQRQADILFYPTFVDEDKAYCGLSGKFPEYINSGKWVLCIVNAPKGYTWLKDEFNRLGIGLVCDGKSTEVVNEIMNFLLKILHGKIAKCEINSETKKKYRIEDISLAINDLLILNKE